MPEYNIEAKTKLDCIWGEAKLEYSASSMSAQNCGPTCEVYEKTGKCEFSVYGNPCAWEKTMEYCESLRGTRMSCPEYCNKEELYCAARYLNANYDWEDKKDIVPTGKCTNDNQEMCCTYQLDARYDAKCDPMNWDFKANDKKIKHCRAHAFSRSCNYYYDAALKIYQAKQGSAEGKSAHDANCKKALAFNSCDPTLSDPDGIFLGDAYCQMSCGTMSEQDGQSGMADAHGADSGCCDTLSSLIAEKAAADKAKADAQDAAVKDGSCKDDEAGLKADWGQDYTCQYCVNAGYCDYGYETEMLKYCQASCKKCGTTLVEEAPVAKPDRVLAAAKSMHLIAERMKAKQNPEPSLITKYLHQGYPDLVELNNARH